MQRKLTALFLAATAIGIGAQNASVLTWIPHGADGLPVPGATGNATKTACELANQARTVTARTQFDCRLVQIVTPPVGTPAPAPIPPPPPPAPPPPAPPPPAPAPAPIGSWVVGQSTAAEPTTPRPAKGVATPDPSYRTPVYRVTDASEPPSGMRRNDYSRRQAFNANNTRQLVNSLNGYWHLYDANTFAYVRQLPGLAGDAEPQWHPSNPDLMYYMPSNGVGMRILELNVVTGVSRTIGDLGARLKARWPTAMAAWTKSEGSPSADGRYWCLMVDGDGWNSVGVVTWDRDTDTILGYFNTGGSRPDHTSMSLSGRYCVVSSTGSLGTVAFSRNFSTQRKLAPGSEHSDLGLLPNGEDVYTSVDYQSNAGEVYFTNLDTGVRTVLFNSYLSGSARAFHFSSRSFKKPGYVLVSAYAEGGGSGLYWMDRRVTLLELKPNPVIRNVAFHRSKHPSSDGYFHESHATISMDGTRIAWTSNWGGSTLQDLNAYQARLFPY